MTRCILLLTLFLYPAIAPGQDAPPQKSPFEHPFTNPVDDPALPRVLIIGDSISIGYTTRVRNLLKGVANVHRPKANCAWSAFGLQNIDSWVGDSDWDVIHFNFGLWDWYGWKQEEKATPETYAANLEGIVKKVRAKTDAELIFAVTTPPCVGPEKKVKFVVSEERAKEFNKAALAVMKKQGVKVNDLYNAIAGNREKYQLGINDVHYNDAGRDVLAAQVASIIKQALPEAEPASE